MNTVPQHIVAIIGGAVAGSEAAKVLAERGIGVVIFDQNARPYGKIEEGLPRWHDKMRIAEFGRIDEAYRHPLVHFVPLTRISRDIGFRDLISNWGFSSVILANGAYRDRSLGLEGVDAYVGKGLYYQNSFMHWFNHFPEKDYHGPQCEITDGAIVVGGGLASIDVVKVLMVENVRRALEKRGISLTANEIEHKGCDKILAENNLTLETLGVKPATLFYRRRAEDMPLVAYRDGATEEQNKATDKARATLLNRAMGKYLFKLEPLARPIDKMVESGRLVGLRFLRTKMENGKLQDVPGSEFDVRALLTISSIGSIPEPLAEIPMKGELYVWRDLQTSRLDVEHGVFGLGNVVTGKGNIAVSRKHSKSVAEYVSSTYFAELYEKPALTPIQVNQIMTRVKERQQMVGYDGNYDAWIDAQPVLDRQG